MTSHSLPSDPVPPADGTGHGRPVPAQAETHDRRFAAFVRSPFRAFRARARDRPTGLFRAGEFEYARLRSLPPFDTDLLILTDQRIMRVRTDARGAVAQLSQATPRQIGTARAEEFRGRTTVTIELHVGSSMRLEETTPAEAEHFVTIVTEVVARFRP